MYIIHRCCYIISCQGSRSLDIPFPIVYYSDWPTDNNKSFIHARYWLSSQCICATFSWIHIARSLAY